MEIKIVMTDHLVAKANSMWIPVPDKSKEEYYEIGTYGFRPILSVSGINYLQTRIQEKRGHNFTIAHFWITSIVGILGALIGVIFLLIR
jgi:hypothetical protein